MGEQDHNLWDEQESGYADIRERMEVLSLPPYSPDLNPIEQVWRKPEWKSRTTGISRTYLNLNMPCPLISMDSESQTGSSHPYVRLSINIYDVYYNDCYIFHINDWCSLSKLSLKGMLKSADVHSVVSTHVETVVLLRGVKTDSHISVDLDVEKLGLKTVK